MNEDKLLEAANELETRASELPVSAESHVLYELCALVRRMLLPDTSEPPTDRDMEVETIGHIAFLLQNLPDRRTAMRAVNYAAEMVNAQPDSFFAGREETEATT